MARLAIVDYGAGNLASVANALSHIGETPLVSGDPKEIVRAEKIVFPGVGAAFSAMKVLKETGLDKAVCEAVRRGIPVLGICIGCQIILEKSEEDGGVETLGLLPGKVVRFRDERGIKIPHMGWNQVNFLKPHPIFKGIPNGAEFYYVHSFHPEVEKNFAFAETTYGTQTFPCVIGENNLIAAQFHLEKSGEYGLTILRNFCNL